MSLRGTGALPDLLGADSVSGMGGTETEAVFDAAEDLDFCLTGCLTGDEELPWAGSVGVSISLALVLLRGTGLILAFSGAFSGETGIMVSRS